MVVVGGGGFGFCMAMRRLSGRRDRGGRGPWGAWTPRRRDKQESAREEARERARRCEGEQVRAAYFFFIVVLNKDGGRGKHKGYHTFPSLSACVKCRCFSRTQGPARGVSPRLSSPLLPSPRRSCFPRTQGPFALPFPAS